MVPRVWFAASLVLFLVLDVAGQSPQFTTATVRSSTSPVDARHVSRVAEDGGYIATNVTLKQLIANAYQRTGFDQREVAGGPDWIGTDRFDLVATTAGGLVLDADGFPSRSLQMLQGLLADRFQLRIRRESQPRPIYALMMAGTEPGPRLRPSTIDCQAAMHAFARGERDQKMCGAAPYPGRLVGHGLTSAELAGLLSTHLDRPVVDRTGLRGYFDLDLEAVEITSRGPFGPSYRPSESKQSIIESLPAQLGLRLERTEGPIEVLIVESAAQPDPKWRDPSPHEQRFVAVEPSVRLEVLDWGGTGRPIVFVSCYLTGHAYDEIAPKLTDQFHVHGFTRRGFGASDRPSGGYDLQRSADDLLAVIDALKMRKPILVGNSCGGWTQTLLAVQHPDRLGGLVYLEAADDPMLTLADYNFPPVDEANQPKRAERPALDYSSFDAYRRTQRARSGVAFPEAQLRYGFAVKPDGSLGAELMSPTVRRAITSGARSKPDFGRVRVPVLAVFRTPPPFEEIARGYVIENEVQRTALRQSTEVERLMTTRWENDLRAAIPAAKIVELPGASLYMFLSNEADVIRELRAFAATLPPNAGR